MKRVLPIIKIMGIILPALANAQANSVELKDGANASLGFYNAIGAAYAAIPATLTQAYTIEIKNIYTGANEVLPVTFVSKADASKTNTITLRPANDVNTVSLTGLSTGSSIFILNDADYIVIDGRPGGTGNRVGLFLENTGTTSNSNTISLINGATNNSIMYCNLTNGTTGSAGRNISFGVSVSNPTGNSDNAVEYCILNNGRYIVNSVGTAANPNTRLKMYGCEFRNIYFVGFWGQAGTGKVLIDSCKFFCNTATGDSPYGILFDSQTDTATITRNQIYNIDNGTKTSAVKGINIRTSIGTNLTSIRNNFIALSASNTASTNVVGIEFSNSATNIVNADVYYNTVRISGSLNSGGTSGNVVSAAFQRTTSVSNAANVFNVFNNIFINERTGGTAGVQHVAMSAIGNAGTFNVNYNTYRSATADLVRWGATAYSTFAAYQPIPGGTNESNSNNELVQFISATDLHLTGSSLGNNNLRALPIANITNDIDGQTRNANFPYRGGDENIAAPLPLQLLSFTALKKGTDIILNWKTTNEVNTRGFEIQRSVDGVIFTTVGYTNATSIAGINHYSFADKNALETITTNQWYYRLKQIDTDNKFRFSPIVNISIAAFVKALTVTQFPNPFTSNFFVSLKSNKNGIAIITITDNNGKSMLVRKAAVIEGSNVINLPVENLLPAGGYYLKVTVGDKSQVMKVLKQ